MSRRKSASQIPPPGMVRFVALIMLLADAAVVVLAVTNFQALGWLAWLAIIGSVGTIYFPIKSLQTGDPEWILLDLMLPG